MEHAVGASRIPVYTPLATRGPVWLTLPAGIVTGALAAGAVAGGLAIAAGMALGPVAIGFAAIFFASVLGGSVGLCPRSDRSLSKLTALTLSVGHAILLLIFLPALFAPAYAQTVLAALAFLPIPEAVASDAILRTSVLYILAIATFSLIAPMSLIILRYISFRKKV